MLQGEPNTMEGPATTSWTRLYVTNRRGDKSFARQITFTCTDAANDLWVSFDGGATKVVVRHLGESLVVPGPVKSFSVRASAATAAWSAALSVA